MIQLDSDSTYGSTVSVNLGSLGNASATIPGEIGYASSAFPQPPHVHRGQPRVKTARGCPALTGQVF